MQACTTTAVSVMLGIGQWVLLLMTHFTDAETKMRRDGLYKAKWLLEIRPQNGNTDGNVQSLLSVAVIKYPKPKQLKKAFILFTFQGYSSSWWGVLWPHCIRRQETKSTNVSAQPTFCFVFHAVQAPLKGMAPPTFRVGFPPQFTQSEYPS